MNTTDILNTAQIERLMRLLQTMDAAIPAGEGTVSVRIFSDASGSFLVEMWGAVVAEGPLSGKIITKPLHDLQPDCVAEVENIVAHLNSILSDTGWPSRRAAEETI